MNLFNRLRKPNPIKIREDADIIGFALHPTGRVEAIKQGSGMYGAGFGEGAFSETAFGTNIALSQSTFGWSAAYTVSVWCYRCIEVRKSAVHRMPWAIYSKRSKKVIPNHPLEIALKRNKQKLFKKIEQSQLLYGETFIELANNDYGFTSDFFWLNNNGMAVLVGAGYIMGYSYTAMQGGQPKSFERDDVAFMKTDNPFNDLRGMSPTEVIMDDVAIDKDVARVVRSYYANDTRVGILLIPKTNLIQPDIERFMDNWKRQNQGVNRAGKPNLVPFDMTVERVQEPATLDDVQLRESVRRSIAAGYGVPLSMAGGWDDAKYQSLPEQRKSFYEETVIPECESIGEFMNTDVMPHVDDSGRAEFKYDFTSILALTEDAQKKNDIYSNRLVSGLISRAEARSALGHPVRPQDEVYYIPAGSTVVSVNEMALVTPTANVVDDTVQEQQGEQPPIQPPAPAPPGKPTPPKLPPNPGQSKLPAPKQPQISGPSAQPPKQLPAPPARKAIAPPQTTALDELNAWEKKALNSNAVKASGFVCYVLPADIQLVVRRALADAGKTATKAVVRAVFAEVRKAIQTPTKPLDYWAKYDSLMAEIGHDWLQTYMRPALAALLPHVHAKLAEGETQSALSGVHPAFTSALLGTDDKPGPLVKLVLAGMAAGNDALAHGSAANPNRPVRTKDAPLEVDWQLLGREARDFSKQYIMKLIMNVDDTTRKATSDAVTKWIESGQPLDKLKEALTDVFNDEARANLIAQTESTRAYAEGSKARYQRAGVSLVKWNTVQSADVCPVCEALGNEPPASIDAGFKAVSGDAFPPNHPGCRCWLRPVVENEE